MIKLVLSAALTAVELLGYAQMHLAGEALDHMGLR